MNDNMITQTDQPESVNDLRSGKKNNPKRDTVLINLETELRSIFNPNISVKVYNEERSKIIKW
jgi:hypothetical protein